MRLSSLPTGLMVRARPTWGEPSRHPPPGQERAQPYAMTSVTGSIVGFLLYIAQVECGSGSRPDSELLLHHGRHSSLAVGLQTERPLVSGRGTEHAAQLLFGAPRDSRDFAPERAEAPRRHRPTTPERASKAPRRSERRESAGSARPAGRLRPGLRARVLPRGEDRRAASLVSTPIALRDTRRAAGRPPPPTRPRASGRGRRETRDPRPAADARPCDAGW